MIGWMIAGDAAGEARLRHGSVKQFGAAYVETIPLRPS